MACTYDIHPRGARLLSFRDVKVGDLITVERGRTKSVCQVVWTADPKTPRCAASSRWNASRATEFRGKKSCGRWKSSILPILEEVSPKHGVDEPLYEAIRIAGAVRVSR
jgi:hypothetical protein